MSDANLYGPIVTGGAVERAMVNFLTALRGPNQVSWIDSYLGEIERIEGYAPGTIERPRGVITSAEFEKWPEDQLPVYMILCPGVTGNPVRRGGSQWEARWGVGIGIVVADPGTFGESFPASRKLAQAHAGAVRAAILQNKSLDGFATGGCTWTDERYDDIPFDDSRMLGGARLSFEVIVETTVVGANGPLVPPAVPTVDPGPLPTATLIDIDTEPITLTEALPA